MKAADPNTTRVIFLRICAFTNPLTELNISIEITNQFNGLDWSLLVKHLEFEGHVFRFRKNETYVPSLRGLVKQYNQQLCISSEITNSNRGFHGSYQNY